VRFEKGVDCGLRSRDILGALHGVVDSHGGFDRLRERCRRRRTAKKSGIEPSL
jgi:hypothetical protein